MHVAARTQRSREEETTTTTKLFAIFSENNPRKKCQAISSTPEYYQVHEVINSVSETEKERFRKIANPEFSGFHFRIIYIVLGSASTRKGGSIVGSRDTFFLFMSLPHGTRGDTHVLSQAKQRLLRCCCYHGGATLVVERSMFHGV